MISDRPFVVSGFLGAAEKQGLPASRISFTEVPAALFGTRPAPSCVLVDVCADPQAAIRISTALADLRQTELVLLLTADRSLSRAVVSALLSCRPSGIFGSRMTCDELMISLRLVMEGQLVIRLDRSGIGGLLLGEMVWQQELPVVAHEFTEEERDLLRMVTAGLSDGEIASRRYLSEATVRRRVHLLRRKTGTTKRVDLAAWGGARGFYRPEVLHSGPGQ
ncbi:MAG: LuxR C-terminal-related transcriptional regulator [Kineosporiaceae bacterium]